MLLKDYLINKRILFKEDKERFIHVLNDRDFCIEDLFWAHVHDYVLLKSIKGSLSGARVTEINLPNLKYVGSMLDCRNASKINLPNLIYVGGYFYCGTAEVNLPNLKYFMWSSSWQRKYKTSLPNLKYVKILGNM